MCCVSVLNVDKGLRDDSFTHSKRIDLSTKRRYAPAKNDSHKASWLKRFSVARCATKETWKAVEAFWDRFHSELLWLSYPFHFLIIWSSSSSSHCLKAKQLWLHSHLPSFLLVYQFIQFHHLRYWLFLLPISYFASNVLWINLSEIVNAHAKKIGQKMKRK